MFTEDFSEPEKYDSWYDKYKSVYEKELTFIKKLLKMDDFVEIGAGTGRFGGELGAIGLIELSEKMIKYSLKKGYEYIKADADNLPLRENSVGSVLFSFSLSFIKDSSRVLKEAFSVAKNKIVIVEINPELSKNYVNNLKLNYKSYNPYIIESIKAFDKKMSVYNISLTLNSEKIIIIGFVIYKKANHK